MLTGAPTDNASDSCLMRRVAEGDVRAFEAAYDRYHTQAFGLAMRITSQPATAEDVTQEAFLSLWRSAARYEPKRGSLKAWLLQIVHNRSVDALRRGARGRRDISVDEVPHADLGASECIDTTVLQRDESRHMRGMLTDLPSKQRQIVELTYYKELSHTEAAHELGLPLGTVKGRLRLAHAKLHQKLALVA